MDSSTAFIYPATGPAATAALHLLDNSALTHITDRGVTTHAGGDALKVVLTSPRPSRGEQLLWSALQALATEHGGVDINEAARLLDVDNLRVLADAFVMRFGLVSEVA